MQTQTTSSRVVAACASRLSRLPFANHPALLFSPRLEEYKHYIFGARAGPGANSQNLFHELAHAAEFGPEDFRTRATAEGFSFKRCHRVRIQGNSYYEPNSMGATRREIDTFAHQLHLLQHCGYQGTESAFFGESARALRQMPDWWQVPGENEVERTRYCQKQTESAYSRIEAKDSLARLESWLDRTSARLKRQRGKPLSGHPPKLPCYRSDGSLVP
jgi:hypothetical protein